MVIFGVEVICALIYAFYRMIYFAHSKDTEFAKSKLAKFFVFAGMFLWAVPIVWIPMDVILSNHSEFSRTANKWITIGF